MTPQEFEEEMLSNPVQNLQYMLRRLGTRYSFLPQLAADGLFATGIFTISFRLMIK